TRDPQMVQMALCDSGHLVLAGGISARHFAGEKSRSSVASRDCREAYNGMAVCL
ncbi:hypothetical protein LTR22_027998, partial [Elasticomyces elasticus]